MNKNMDRNQTGYTSSRILMMRLIREFISPYRWWMALAVVFMAVFAGATALSVWLLDPVINEIFIARNEELLLLVALAITATFAVKGIANYLQTVLMSKVGLSIVADCQKRLFAHLTGMDVGFFQNQPVGSLISRFTVDINAMRGAVSNAITSLGKDVLSLIGLVSVMVIQDAQLSVVALVIFPITIYPIIRIGKRLRKAVANTQKEMGLMTALLGQTFQGIRVVKSYRMEGYEGARIGGLVDRIYSLNMKASRTQALHSPLMETVGGFAVAAVIVYGGSRVLDGHTDPGSFISFIAALLSAYEPMKKLANLNAIIQTGLAGAERMYHVLDAQSSIVEKPGAAELSVSAGAIQFDRVSFGYDDERKAIRGLSLDVPAGKKVALVGPSGAGKTTIMNLIPRFFDVDEGSVRIDGVDIRDVTFSSLHENIALVSQEVTLFDDTVRANIAYGRAGASDAEIKSAARMAAAHDFIMELPEGYDTIVGEQGLKLSGGQRQRLSIARAILKNAPILLLDEATSALDTESEQQVQAALASLMTNRTALVIAHRLSTVVNTDLIYVVVDGNIAEQGTHDELIAKDGHYARLYEMQFRENDQETATEAPAP